MCNKYIIANFGEIFLKGGNISFFENKLLKNFSEKLGDLKNKIKFEKTSGGSFYLKLSEDISQKEIERIKEIIKNTPGFSTFFLAYAVSPLMEEIKKGAILLAEEFFQKNSNIKTFGIASEKTEKESKIKTKEVNVEVGSAVWNFFKEKNNELKVNLDQPDLKIQIKIKNKVIFIFTRKEKAVGGLPVGSSGRAVALFSGGIDSPVSAFLAMKRGLEITAVHFHSVPKTSPESIEKVKDLVTELSKFQKNIKLYLIPIIPIQKDIVQNAERKLSIVLQRRAFLKLAYEISQRENIKKPAFITGDSLGQVASQTLENMSAVSEVLNEKEGIILRPLITYDKTEIIKVAKKIGTLEISEKSHEDTCSLFVPKNPETRANSFKVKREEKKLNKDLLNEALEKSEVIKL